MATAGDEAFLEVINDDPPMESAECFLSLFPHLKSGSNDLPHGPNSKNGANADPYSDAVKIAAIVNANLSSAPFPGSNHESMTMGDPRGIQAAMKEFCDDSKETNPKSDTDATAGNKSDDVANNIESIELRNNNMSKNNNCDAGGTCEDGDVDVVPVMTGNFVDPGAVSDIVAAEGDEISADYLPSMLEKTSGTGDGEESEDNNKNVQINGNEGHARESDMSTQMDENSGKFLFPSEADEGEGSYPSEKPRGGQRMRAEILRDCLGANFSENDNKVDGAGDGKARMNQYNDDSTEVLPFDVDDDDDEIDTTRISHRLA